MTDAQENHIWQMPGHSHKLLIIFQHVLLSDSVICSRPKTLRPDANKYLLNFIWLISTSSIFVTSQVSTCCSPRQTYSELIWRRNEACWISSIRFLMWLELSHPHCWKLNIKFLKQRHELQFYLFFFFSSVWID